IDGRFHVLRRIERVGPGHALAPPLADVGDRLHQQHVALGLRAERRAKRRYERHPDSTQLETLDLHFSAFLSDSARRWPAIRTIYPASRSNPTTVPPAASSAPRRVRTSARHRCASAWSSARRRSTSRGTATVVMPGP